MYLYSFLPSPSRQYDHHRVITNILLSLLCSSSLAADLDRLIADDRLVVFFDRLIADG